MRRWIGLAALSGCIWGLLAIELLEGRINAGTLGGLAASPLIGVMMGHFARGFRHRPLLGRVTITVLTLYGAVALFGAAGGAANRLFGPTLASSGGVLESVVAFMVGLTFTGYVLLLLPLAYVNYLLLDAIGWDTEIGTRRSSRPN